MRRYTFLVFVTVILIGLGSPVTAQYSGSYDVGGGNMDFSTPVSAAAMVSIYGVTGPVICNIYSGTMWSGTLNFPANIPGTSPVNTITFRNASGHSPVLTNPYYNNNIIYMNSADYITIEGLEFSGCEETVIYFIGSESDSCREIRMIGNYVHDFGTNEYTNSAGIVGSYSADCEIIGNEVNGDARGIGVWDSDRALIANNMVYDCVPGINPGGARCIEVFYGSNNLVYHNSATSVSANILYCSDTEDITIYNNVLYQDYFMSSGNLYAIGLYSISSVVSDYNDLYAPNSYVGYHHYHGLIQTFSGWQDTMGVDLNSISADPNFVSGTNLHVNDPSPVGIAGIAVPEVTDDYDGDPRKNPNPDIGADEYVFPLVGNYDINGGNNDFATIDEGINQAIYVGLGGHVYFNVYSDTYNGQIDIPDIPSTAATRTLTIQAADGETAIITNTTGTTQTDGNGFYLIGADYITIQGFEITNTAAHGIMNTFTGSDSSTHNSFVGNYIHDVGVLGDYAGIYLLNSPDCEVLGNEIESDYYGIRLSTSERCLIANNMVYFASLSGIYDDEGSDNRYYFNSVYHEMDPTTTYNMYLYHGTDTDVKNNVLYHSGGGTHYAISIVGDLLTYPITSDYNDLYAPSAYVGYYGGNQTTLANWQTATELDSNSLNVDPSFVSLGTPDLHVNSTSPLEMMGIPIRDVTDDFDGTTRNESSPDIGADEFYGPMAGIYDVGGGAMHYTTLTEAVNHLNGGGMAGPVTLNTYTDSYSGITLSSTIPGLGASNPLVIQNAPGESPGITNTFGYGIRINNADYITIQGFEISNCRNDGLRISGSSSDSCTNISIIGNYIHDVATYSGIIRYNGIYLRYGDSCEIIGNEIDGSDDANGGINVSSSRNNVIANNMVYNCFGTAITNSDCSNDQIYYNSVLNANRYALYLNDAINVMVKNNILHQTGINRHALYIADSLSTFPVFSDYNNLYAPNGYAGYYLGHRTTLADFQTATGLDANSVSGDPNYASTSDPYDLHLQAPSAASNVGVPLAEVTDDLDGDMRDLSTPDMGADEFSSDYWVILSPESLYDTTIANGNVDYMLTVQNVGDMNDTYDISVSTTGETWPHAIYDATGTTIISSIVVNSGASDSFLVRVTIPGTASYNQNSYGQVVVESQNGTDNMLADTSYTNTYTIMGGSYDVGGGDEDFRDPFEAASALQTYGIGAACVFNLYTGTYEGQVDLPPIAGSSPTNIITFQAALGEEPMITNPYGSSESDGNGFRILGADYIDITGLEITGCYYDAINAYSATDDSSTNLWILNNYIHDNGINMYAIGISLFKTANCVVAANEVNSDGIYSGFSTGNLITNNMVYNNAGYDISIDFSDSTWCCYNSILSTLNAGIQHYQDSPNHGNVILNNSVYMTIWGYAIYIPTASGMPDICDYNNFYAPNGYVGYRAGSNYTTLIDWQTATGLDLNSISADPGYLSITSPYDLHITEASPLDSAATPIAGITVDFDWETRHAVYPDIGADEVGIVGPPEPVGDLIITLSSGTDDSTDITLIWSPISGAQQYHIYKSTTNPGSGFALIGSTTDTTYTDTSAIINESKSYFYVTTDNQSLDTGSTDINFSRRSDRGIDHCE